MLLRGSLNKRPHTGSYKKIQLQLFRVIRALLELYRRVHRALCLSPRPAGTVYRPRSPPRVRTALRRSRRVLVYTAHVTYGTTVSDGLVYYCTVL